MVVEDRQIGLKAGLHREQTRLDDATHDCLEMEDSLQKDNEVEEVDNDGESHEHIERSIMSVFKFNGSCKVNSRRNCK